jgi:hypothetical protein
MTVKLPSPQLAPPWGRRRSPRPGRRGKPGHWRRPSATHCWIPSHPLPSPAMALSTPARTHRDSSGTKRTLSVHARQSHSHHVSARLRRWSHRVGPTVKLARRWSSRRAPPAYTSNTSSPNWASTRGCGLPPGPSSAAWLRDPAEQYRHVVWRAKRVRPGVGSAVGERYGAGSCLSVDGGSYGRRYGETHAEARRHCIGKSTHGRP